ncbi:hypothetical protein KY334_07065 [Candidatus Woesearchaeota archaeon]|nr:hypothetical protein [Candidatus Woesearchaeota archaeon]
MKELTQEQIETIRQDPDNTSWDYISRVYILPEWFMREFHNYLDWNHIISYQTLSGHFITELYYNVDNSLMLYHCCDNKNYHNLKLLLKLGIKLDNIAIYLLKRQ